MITILVPTAVGKTRISAMIAARMDAEIISADSRQVFRGMDLGTGKDLQDYFVDGSFIPYHLIDIRQPGEEYSVWDFSCDFKKAYLEIRSRGRQVILCGGTGLYIEAVIGGYYMPQVPEDKNLRNSLEKESIENLITRLASLRPLHNTTDITDRARLIRAIEIETWKLSHPREETFVPPNFILGITLPREELRMRITQRLHKRIEQGMIEEVEQLKKLGISHENLDSYGLEYRFISRYLKGQMSKNEMVESLNTAIHQFAKRQMTWFRRMERKGFRIHWLDGMQLAEEVVKKAMQVLDSHPDQWKE